jgi:hypothetical protein
MVVWEDTPPLGWNYVGQLENGFGSGTSTHFGDNGGTSTTVQGPNTIQFLDIAV